MLIVTDATLANRGVLETRSLPKKFLGRVMLVPQQTGAGLWLRLVMENKALRYMVTQLPFALAPVVFQDLALPVMEAPARVLVLVALVELKVLRLSKSARARAVSEDKAARRLDTLAFRARACRRRIAAQHDMAEGQLRPVIEQSELAHIPPLTLVSVQTERPTPHLPPRDPRDLAVLQDGLFDAGCTERDLLSVNHRDEIYLRDIAHDMRTACSDRLIQMIVQANAED